MVSKLLLIIVVLSVYKSERYLNSNDTNAVVSLKNEEEFNSFIKDNKLTMVKFFATWCIHCKKLAPIYAELAEVMKKEYNITIAEVDVDLNPWSRKKFSIKTIPHVRLFKKKAIGTKSELYTGERTVEAMKEFILKNKKVTTELEEVSVLSE